MNKEWDSIHDKDLWVTNKLILSTRLGYLCGPAGTDVPYPGDYIVRPSMNLMGMGMCTRNEYLTGNTDHLHPAEFWSVIFQGEHLSVDYHWGECSLVTKATRSEGNPYYKFDRWDKVDMYVPPHPVLEELVGEYEWINCEFIDGHLIEVQFHNNSDFRYGNAVAIPVWEGGEYIEDPDYKRKGFIIY